MDRLKDKVAIVIGAGQTAGEDIGNGRATTIRFAQEGARVLAVDLNLASAQQSLDLASQPNLDGLAMSANTADSQSMRAVIDAAMQRWGRIDILHYNVGINIVGGPQTFEDIEDAAFDRVMAVNLRGAIMACKFVTPVMRAQQSGAITLVSSISAVETMTPQVAYSASKAGILHYMQMYAAQNAEYGIRCNAILPGRMQTAMSITSRMAKGDITRDDLIAQRRANVPLHNRVGTGWDTANAALFLASDEAQFITGVALPVDGGSLVRIGW